MNNNSFLKKMIMNCAPTLAGIKTGSLYAIEKEESEGLTEKLGLLNRKYASKGIRFVMFKRSSKRVLVYLYRPDMLRKDLSDPDTVSLLKSFGYSMKNVENSIKELALRLDSYESFPHEIGVFLGYPPKDVIGFINDPHKGVRLSGFWKVYSDEDKTGKLFEKYRKCTEVYRNMLMMGRTLDRMVV